MDDNVNVRFKKVVRGKMNKLFKIVLLMIEQQTKNYGIQPQFFAKRPKGKEEGFPLIRKTLLDLGNDFVRFMEVIIDNTIITPKNSVIEIKDDKDAQSS